MVPNGWSVQVQVAQSGGFVRQHSSTAQYTAGFRRTSLALAGGVEVEHHVEGLPQLHGGGPALGVLADRPHVHGLGVEGAVKELLRLQQDRQTGLTHTHTHAHTHTHNYIYIKVI